MTGKPATNSTAR